MGDPEKPAPEHLEFMQQLVDNITKMTGGDKSVACIGDENNGIYCVMVCVSELPAPLVMMTLVHMLVNNLLKDMGERYNNANLMGASSPSKYHN